MWRRVLESYKEVPACAGKTVGYNKPKERRKAETEGVFPHERSHRLIILPLKFL